MTLQDHISDRFQRLFSNYRKEIENVRKDSSADAIHDARVASRRIIETLRVFQGVLDDGVAAPIEKKLKRWMKHTSTVRDLDVILELAENADAAAPAKLIARWKKKREKNWTKLLRVVSSDAIWEGDVDESKLPVDGKRRLKGTFWDLGLDANQNASVVLPFLLERYVAVGNGIGRDATEDQVYHSFRLRTKRVRYTLESFEDLYPKEGIKEILGTLKEFQNVLGALHDCAVASEVAQKAASGRDKLKPDADRFGEFAATRAAELRKEWHGKWKAFASPAKLNGVNRFLRDAVGSKDTASFPESQSAMSA